MARAIWSGVLAFGLVSVPVELYSATEPHEPTFHQFENGTTDRIRYQRVNERTGQEVKYADIVRGADVGGGNYVLLDQDDLDSVAPGRSRSLDIHTFVDLDEIDPIYFNKAYYLGPRGDETRKVYALLRDAMGTSNKAAIATFVMRSKEYLAAVHADGDVLVLETLFFGDEVRDPHQVIDNIPGSVQLSPQEVRMATQLIETMAGPWKPSDYRDTYTDRINELIDAKVHQKQFQPTEQAPTATNVVDLMERLRASLDAAKKPPASGGASNTSTSNTSSSKTGPGKSGASKTSPGKSSSSRTSADKTSSSKSSARKTSGKTGADKSSADKSSADNTNAAKTTAKQAAAGKSSR
jgi:DNA end-binding protein Ku